MLSLWFLYYPPLESTIPWLTHCKVEETEHSIKETVWDQGFDSGIVFLLESRENVAPWKRV